VTRADEWLLFTEGQGVERASKFPKHDLNDDKILVALSIDGEDFGYDGGHLRRAVDWDYDEKKEVRLARRPVHGLGPGEKYGRRAKQFGSASPALNAPTDPLTLSDVDCGHRNGIAPPKRDLHLCSLGGGFLIRSAHQYPSRNDASVHGHGDIVLVRFSHMNS
jgi:hypothetical protein